MENPMDNIIEGVTQLIEKISNVFLSKEQIGDNILNQTNYGKPNCIENIDCNSITQCMNNCTCVSGECYK